MGIRIWLDASEWDDMLDRHEQIHPLVKAALDGVLQEGFAQTQAATHVQSGKLKASGGASSSAVGDTWRGEVKYDAMHHGRIYATYERERGGDHDFLAPMWLLDEQFLRAMHASVGE